MPAGGDSGEPSTGTLTLRVFGDLGLAALLRATAAPVANSSIRVRVCRQSQSRPSA
jgi:hypothetical protein